jgi:hypothetical protein
LFCPALEIPGLTRVSLFTLSLGPCHIVHANCVIYDMETVWPLKA